MARKKPDFVDVKAFINALEEANALAIDMARAARGQNNLHFPDTADLPLMREAMLAAMLATRDLADVAIVVRNHIARAEQALQLKALEERVLTQNKVTFKVIRQFERDPSMNKVIATGLTLEQAREHCKDPETSSRSCVRPENVNRTQRLGAWFESYTEE